MAVKKHIINYAKTKDVFTAYRESGFSAKYYETFLPFIRYLPLEDYSGRYRNLQTQYYQGSWTKKISKILKTHEFEWVPDLLCFGSKRWFFCRKERIQERTNKN